MAVSLQKSEPERSPPALTEAEQAWRPRSGHDVLLSDRDLAKLGLLAQLEAQCRMGVAVALKGARSLTLAEWRRLETTPFDQLVTKLRKTAEQLDPVLLELASAVEAEHEDALKHRHQNLHSVWAHNSDKGALMAWDLKRDEKLHVVGLDAAVERVAALTFKTKACATRVAELIVSGALQESQEETGPRVSISERWVRL